MERESHKADDARRDAADAQHDEDVVARLRAELDAARSRVRDAWERYRHEAGGPNLPAIAGSPLLPALLALVQAQT